MSTPPPLPQDWTEHTAPTGHKYYYNKNTKKSTYKRPIQADQPRPSNNAIPITEWSVETQPEFQDAPQQGGRMMGQEMWKKLEDKPRKKYAL